MKLLKIAFITLAVTTGAFAAEQLFPDDETFRAVVKGKTAFERRMTVIPMSVCEVEPCPKSRVYWSFVVKGEYTKYELTQPFGFDSETPPEAIEITGTIIRPGTHVALEAAVRPISEEYALISDVSSADVVMD